MLGSLRMTTEELQQRYAAGERDFRGVSLIGADLRDSYFNTTMPDGSIRNDNCGSFRFVART